MRIVNWSRLREDAVAFGYILGWKAFGKLPSRVAYALGDWAARRVSHNGAGPQQLRKNLARVLGCPAEEVPGELVLASMRSYIRYWIECFRLPHIASAESQLPARIAQGGEGLHFVKEAIDSGDGLILVLTHSGNWDMAGVWLVDQIGGFTTVAERLKPESLFDAFVEFRESLGFTILPLTGGTPPMETLRETLADGGAVALLGDRDLGGRGVPVKFFGETTTMPTGAAKLAIETGARLHPVGLSFTESGWHLHIHPRIAVSGRQIGDIVQSIANCFEHDIAGHPADWHMLQPLWLADRKRRSAKTGGVDCAKEQR